MADHKKLSQKEIDSILNGVHRVLKNREVEQPIRLQFSSAEASLCWQRECQTLPNGDVSCRWVQVPC